MRMETSRLMSYRGWTRATALRAGAVIAGVALAGSVALAQTVKSIGTFSSWTAFTHGEGASLLCFVTAQPTKQEPAGAKRSPAFVYVSSWPKDGVKAEVSVRVGYQIQDLGPSFEFPVDRAANTFRGGGALSRRAAGGRHAIMVRPGPAATLPGAPDRRRARSADPLRARSRAAGRARSRRAPARPWYVVEC